MKEMGPTVSVSAQVPMDKGGGGAKLERVIRSCGCCGPRERQDTLGERHMSRIKETLCDLFRQM